MMKLIFAPLVLLASPALATGFGAVDLADAANSGAVADGMIRTRLDQAAESLRLALALDPAQALAAATPEEAALLKAALGIDGPSGNLRARWFMAGAIGRSYPGAQATAFYNPLARGWLIVRWEPRDGSWVIRQALVASAGPAEWIEKPGPYLANFVADYRATEPNLGDRSSTDAGIEAGRWISGVALWLRDPANAKEAAATHALIVSGHTAKLGGGAIDTMPARARATFWPVAGFTREGGVGSLIYGSALYPQLLIAADFERDATPRLARLTLVNLNNAGAVK
jgi:hypothetical protein